MANSFLEASARDRVQAVCDAGSFQEILKPSDRISSPHMALLEQPVAFDDGVVIGRATLGGAPVLVAAQEGEFLGGAIGEVHGAKITALIAKAVKEKPRAVLLIFESGGVRLHEANAGLIAVSEIMRAVCAARAHGIQFIGLISLNIGILNLLPIPLLDGGYLLFYLIEFVRRKPLSNKKMMISQRVGMLILGLLTGIALYNDACRYLLGS